MESLEGNMADTPRSGTVSTRLQRIATLANQMPGEALTTLAQHIDMDWLKEAYRRTRKDGAPGVDGKTAEGFATDLEANLQVLLDRAKSGTYVAPPVRRVHIPKGSGTETRPIGVPTFEDKVLQRAVAMVLEAIYEQDFLDCSYGFRPGRSAHQALQATWDKCMAMGGGWIIEIDIRGFYDAMSHSHLREILRQRVRDGVLLRLIGKWLKAGVVEDGNRWFPESGSPQGGVISPVLSNVYLHEVLDLWWTQVVRPRLKGSAGLVRYADDALLLFRREDDARRVMAVLAKRFARYGLILHPEKTRLMEFRRPRDKGPRSQSFDFLGFTHYWGRSRKGHWVVKRKTAKGRFSRALKAVAQWCRLSRHLPVRDQHDALNRKLRGHYAYYGITGNAAALQRFRWGVRRAWCKWLNRRSQRGDMPWDRFARLERRLPLAPAVVMHSVYRQVANP
jgi:group II intron reverse transcriptase/maturase